MPGISGRPSGWAGEGDATDDTTVAPAPALSTGSGLSEVGAFVEACRAPVPNCCPTTEFSYSSILVASADLLPLAERPRDFASVLRCPIDSLCHERERRAEETRDLLVYGVPRSGRRWERRGRLNMMMGEEKCWRALILVYCMRSERKDGYVI
jgi:hypothetical protein